MHLINCTTLQLEEFFGNNIPPYAILSHTWGDDEVTFVDLPLDSLTTKAKAGYQKIEFTCQQALIDDVKYVWVDTCCIDKRSSSELSEAINSMFAWYRGARYCYAYLSDVSASKIGEQFRKSRWFTRGWTLQELLAPRDVVFFNQQWDILGQKLEHAEIISDITGIESNALVKTNSWSSWRYDPFGSYCVAKRMSWASRRETKRPEDMAYCLLGIFDISMPLLYGEGSRAFLRLQEEIIRVIGDDSILAWGLIPDAGICSRPGVDDMKDSQSLHPIEETILAISPRDFKNCGSLERSAPSRIPFTLTNFGLTIELPILRVTHSDGYSNPYYIYSSFEEIAILSCSIGASPKLVGILLHEIKGTDNSPKKFFRSKWYSEPHYYSSLRVSLRDATKAVSSTIVIQKSNWSPRYTMAVPNYQQLVINTSRNLRDAGYHVRKTTYWRDRSLRGVFVNHEQWFPEEMTLNLRNFNKTYIIIGFCFEPIRDGTNPTFTAFVCTGRSTAIVLSGSVFSDDDYFGILRLQEHHNDIAVIDSQGIECTIGTRIRTVAVHGFEISELNVDAIPTTGRFYRMQKL